MTDVASLGAADVVADEVRPLVVEGEQHEVDEGDDAHDGDGCSEAGIDLRCETVTRRVARGGPKN